MPRSGGFSIGTRYIECSGRSPWEPRRPRTSSIRWRSWPACPWLREHCATGAVLLSLGVSSTELLGSWDTRPRNAEWASNTTVIGSEKWLTSPVSARGHMWGRVILVGRRSATTDYSIILEQGATTLALHMLIERDEHLLEQQTHRTLLSDIIHHRYTSSDDIHARAQALGLPRAPPMADTDDRRKAVDPLLPDLDRHKRASEEVSAVSAARRRLPAPGSSAARPGPDWRLFTAASPASASRLLDGVAKAIRDRVARLEPHRPIVIGVGAPVQAIDDLSRSFAEANEAADVAFSLPSHRHYATVADIHLRGLVHLLREDPRVHSYRERELGPLLAYDSRRHTQLFKTLLVYLEVGAISQLRHLVPTSPGQLCIDVSPESKKSWAATWKTRRFAIPCMLHASSGGTHKRKGSYGIRR